MCQFITPNCVIMILHVVYKIINRGKILTHSLKLLIAGISYFGKCVCLRTGYCFRRFLVHNRRDRMIKFHSSSLIKYEKKVYRGLDFMLSCRYHLRYHFYCYHRGRMATATHDISCLQINTEIYVLRRPM